MVTDFNICDRVYFFNATTEKIESDTVRDIRIIAKEVHAAEDGSDICGEMVVLYCLKGSGSVLAENEVFDSEDACRDHYAKIFVS